MRDSNKTIHRIITTEISEKAATEEIKTTLEDKQNKSIQVVIVYRDTTGKQIGDEMIMLEGEEYGLLMSANPDFAPEKPKNEYREADLWYVLDTIRY